MADKIDVYKVLKANLLLPYGGKGNFPLYKRSEAYNSNNIFNEPVYTDSLWDELVQKTYNSPRNIRKIIISKDTIANVFWVPYIKDNKKSSICICKSINLNDTSNLVFNKSILPRLNRWALPNLEEVYIDIAGICSKELPTLDITNIDGMHLRHIFESKVHNTFYGENKNRYKRIKKIVFIGNITKDILKDLTSKDVPVTSSLLDEISKSSIVFQHRGDIIDTNNYNSNFSCSPNLYQFDREYLVDYFRDLTRDLDRSKSNTSKLDEEDVDDLLPDTLYNELEEAIDRLNKSLSDKDKLVTLFQVLGYDAVASLNEELLISVKDVVNRAFEENSNYIG